MSDMTKLREEAIDAAWDYVGPSLVTMNDEKGPAGVWSTGYRAGWDAAARATDGAVIGAIPVQEAAKSLKRIVEEIDGAMNHGTWRDERGMRLKDTPEWVALYNAIAASGEAHDFPLTLPSYPCSGE